MDERIETMKSKSFSMRLKKSGSILEGVKPVKLNATGDKIIIGTRGGLFGDKLTSETFSFFYVIRFLNYYIYRCVTHLFFRRMGPSLHPSVRPSVCPSVRHQSVIGSLKTHFIHILFYNVKRDATPRTHLMGLPNTDPDIT